MAERFRVVPAAYVILRRQRDGTDEILLQLRQNTGYRDGHWASAAAGHVEAGESVLEAACREAAEELGIQVDRASLVPLTAMHRTHGNQRSIDERVDFFFECRVWGGEPHAEEHEKAADVRWFALDDLPEPVVPHERKVFEALRTASLSPITTFGFEAAPS